MDSLSFTYIESELYRECERLVETDYITLQWHEGRVDMLKTLIDDMLYDDDPKKTQLFKHIDRAMYLGRKNARVKHLNEELKPLDGIIW